MDDGGPAMQKHFVTFLSPGTMVAETTQKPIDSWDVETACNMAHDITEPHGATPYGFYFTTRARADDELDSKEIDRSGTYYLGGRIETLTDIEARGLPSERVLRSNMRTNKWDRVVTNDNSWRWTQPLHENDTVLDWSPSRRNASAQ